MKELDWWPCYRNHPNNNMLDHKNEFILKESNINYIWLLKAGTERYVLLLQMVDRCIRHLLENSIDLPSIFMLTRKSILSLLVKILSCSWCHFEAQ